MPNWRRPTLPPSLDRAEGARLIRFGVVGVSNGVVTFGLYAALVGLGIDYLVAAAVGYAAAILNGYTWNRIWTFQAGPFHLPGFSRYLLVSVGGLVANLLGLRLAVEYLEMGELVAEVVTLTPIVLVTFSLNRRWTFRPTTESG
jgi:putative flippase GtrA